MESIIVARHTGLIEWLHLHGVAKNTPVISHVADPEDIKGKHVYGVLPLRLAAFVGLVTEVAMPNLRPEQRGKELTPEEMDEAGATLQTYRPPKVLPNNCCIAAGKDSNSCLECPNSYWLTEPSIVCTAGIL